jgi:hypothetical protein
MANHKASSKGGPIFNCMHVYIRLWNKEILFVIQTPLQQYVSLKKRLSYCY